jgi:hypothetical protein
LAAGLFCIGWHITSSSCVNATEQVMMCSKIACRAGVHAGFAIELVTNVCHAVDNVLRK